MTFLKSERMRRVRPLLTVAVFMAALLTLFCLSAAAELSCGHDMEAKNGFCTELECEIGYEIPTINEEGVYEIANAGQLYYFKNEILQKKAPEARVSAKLTAHIVVNSALIDMRGDINPEYLDEEGNLIDGVYHWQILGETVISNVVFDGDGYTISGLYGVRTDELSAGFFGKAENVTLKNLGILESIFSSDAPTGAFVGEAINNCVVENCFVVDSVIAGAQSAGLVGKLGYADKPSTLRNCYAEAQSVVFECAEQNTVSKCYYLGVSETDTLEGTTFVTDFSTDALKAALSTEETKWVVSCLRNVLMQREEHYYKNVCDADCVGCDHTREVGEEGRVEHKFDNKCDEKCNICGNIRTLEKDHYYAGCQTICPECGYERASAPESHKFTNLCDEYCNHCHFKRELESKDHYYSNVCDEYCNQCNHKREVEEHPWTDKCDMVCDVCGTTRPGDHVYSFDCDGDCNDCGFVRDTTHTFGEYAVVKEATTEEEGLKERACSVCGLKETLAIEKLSVLDAVIDSVPWLAIGGILAAVVVAIVVILLICKKRGGKKPKKEKKAEKPAKKEAPAKAAEESAEAPVQVVEESAQENTEEAPEQSTEE